MQAEQSSTQRKLSSAVIKMIQRNARIFWKINYDFLFSGPLCVHMYYNDTSPDVFIHCSPVYWLVCRFFVRSGHLAYWHLKLRRHMDAVNHCWNKPWHSCFWKALPSLCRPAEDSHWAVESLRPVSPRAVFNHPSSLSFCLLTLRNTNSLLETT